MAAVKGSAGQCQTRVYLVSDTRERYVHGFISALFGPANVGHQIGQINTGDYLICRRVAGEAPEILACIERKTLKDFASSFRDGRYENRLKMIDLRDRTGCQLFFFVEGPAFPKPTQKFSRTPYAHILAAMTHMMLRDGIHMVQTENEIGTAQRLLDFVQSLGKMDFPYSHPVDAAKLVVGGREDPEAATRPEETGTDIPDTLTGVVAKSNHVMTVEMWARLPGISLTSAQVIAESFSVADLVSGRVPAEEVDALRTPGGRVLVKTGRASLGKLQRGGLAARALEIKILSGVPGLSVAMATLILSEGGPGGKSQPLSAFLAQSLNEMAATPLRQKGRTVRLGEVRAGRIRLLMVETFAADVPEENAEDKAVSGEDAADEAAPV